MMLISGTCQGEPFCVSELIFELGIIMVFATAPRGTLDITVARIDREDA